MSKILFVSSLDLTQPQNGGVHRDHQIDQDLKSLYGETNVVRFELLDWWKNNVPPLSKLTQRADRLAHRLGVSWRFGKASREPFFFSRLPQTYVDHYCRLLEEQGPFRLVILDHFNQRDLLDINKKLGIPTIAFPHNLDSLCCDFDTKNKGDVLANFAEELEFLEKCDQVFCISKVETGFLLNLGLTSTYYPYFPPQTWADELFKIRNLRKQCDPESFFVVVGSANYGPIQRSLQNFIDHDLRPLTSLSPPIRFVGSGMQSLKVPPRLRSSVQMLGKLSFSDFNLLITRCRAIIAPKSIGFGFPTRIIDSAVAGVPCLTSKLLVQTEGLEKMAHGIENWVEAFSRSWYDSPEIPDKPILKIKPRLFEPTQYRRAS